jgi:hypothetical protein
MRITPGVYPRTTYAVPGRSSVNFMPLHYPTASHAVAAGGRTQVRS